MHVVDYLVPVEDYHQRLRDEQQRAVLSEVVYPHGSVLGDPEAGAHHGHIRAVERLGRLEIPDSRKLHLLRQQSGKVDSRSRDD